MGWQDRDWAKLDERELAELYGVGRPRRIRLREGVATAIVLSAFATLVLGRVHLLAPLRATAFDPAYPQRIIYGIRGTNTADPYGPGGANTACTAASFDPSRGWQCQYWAIDTVHLPIVAPASYNGTCADAKVDQSSGSWLCVSATPPGAETNPTVTS